MKIIPGTRSVHYIRYLRFYYHHWVDTTTGELLVLKGIIPTMFGTDMVYQKRLKMSKEQSEAVNRRRTDNTMATRYQRSNQNPSIEEGQTTQWPKDKG